MEPITFLTYLAVVLLLGIICTLLSQKIKIPNILLLIATGILISNLYYKGESLIQFPDAFLTCISVLALVLIVFDASSRFKLGEFTNFSVWALKLAAVFLVLNVIFLTFLTFKLFPVGSVLIALLFSTLMSGTAPDAVVMMFGKSKNKIFELLEVEAIINTPLIVLLPFIIIDFIKSVKVEYVFSKFIEQVGPFIQQFVTGIGAGMVVGLIVLKIMKRKYSETLSPLAIITSALLAYTIAENLGGNGVLAVTTMGLFFGNIYVTHKVQLREVSAFFANSLEILVFILIGLIIKIPFNSSFIIKSLILFAAYLVIRYLAIELSLNKLGYNLKEKLFMTFNVQKGIAVAVVAFTLTTLSIAGIETILHLILLFMLYSIILSTIVVRFSGFFVNPSTK
ncbi:cation:proton antiporter [Candidatus Woesearchaeota archaeon]|nr:cation:proton antiporter [Candidatus Woesearchaeota archaeon]